MINDALEFIRREIRDQLAIDDAEVILDHAHRLKETSWSNGVILSLVNIEEETVLKNTSPQTRFNDKPAYRQPPLFLNLYLLMAFEFGNYTTSLLRLTEVIEHFQNRPVFAAAGQSPANPFPAGLEKLIFDFYNLSFEQLNHLWAVFGGAYFPSVLYKVRMIKIQADEMIEGPEIKRVRVDTGQR